MASFACPICCASREFSTFPKLFRHITVFHQNAPRFEITCNLSETCGVSYRTFSAYKSHLYRHHSVELRSTDENTANSNIFSDDVDSQNFNGGIGGQDFNGGIGGQDFIGGIDDQDLFDAYSELDVLNTEGEAASDNTTLSTTNTDEETNMISMLDIKRSYASFILHLREEFLLPKSTTNVVSTYITTLINHLEILLEQKASRNCSISPSSSNTSNMKVIELQTLKNTMNEISTEIQNTTKNEYQFLKNCERYFDYHPPTEIVLSDDGEESEYGYYIPIDKTLLFMLRSQPLLAQILENVHQQRITTKNDDDLMLSFRDGCFGNRVDDDSLMIQLYLDDIGLTNPIGAKKDQHKMSMVYFSLEDTPEQYRSQLDFIHLVGLCRSKILKDDVKAKRFFQPIIHDLNKLQLEGLFINDNHLKFSFSTVVADNLAAHSMGGFQSCFSNGFFCRRCYIKYTDKHLPISTTKIISRTCLDHDDLVKQIITDPRKSPLMGVIGQSPIHDLIGFHPITSIPGDLMHDFIEGVCPLVMMAILKHASSRRLITYAGIQTRTEDFHYGHFDAYNRPPPIQIKHLQNERIVATASQKLCLFRLFPLIFSGIIDSLPSFIVYKQLREIIDLVLSTPFRKQWLPVLHDLCVAFHRSMLTHFPNKMIPKIHFVCEYDQIVYDYGPPIRQWCFRYEACHAYFKKITIRSNNFKNVPKMLATRYSLKQVFHMSRLSHLKTSNYATRIQKIDGSAFTMKMKQILFHHFGDISLDKDLIQCNALCYENIEYCRFAVYVIDLLSINEQPVFGQIIRIVKTKEKWWLLVDVLKTMDYDERLSAWEVKSIDQYVILDPHYLKYYYKGLDVYELNNKSFVSYMTRLTLY